MNLKESFRYQRFLDNLMSNACSSVQEKEHCLTTTKKHLRHKSNPEASDFVEEVECDSAFFPTDAVVQFMFWIVEERQKLTIAIGKAKASIEFDIDAAVETNKFRQSLSRAIRWVLQYTPSKRIEQGCDYKFNVDGNQTPYVYEVEVTTSEAYDRDKLKATMLDAISTADTVSAEIDKAMINTTVEYEPMYDVNESFEDIMEKFLVRINAR